MKKNILILEDEKEIAQLYAKCLGTKGYITEIAFNGIEGLKKLKEFTPQLILLDVNMPQMGGLEFYQKVYTSADMPRYPILVLTGRAELEALFKDFHVDGFLVKPFEASLLLKEVDIIFNKHYSKKIENKVKKVVIIEDVQESAVKIFSTFFNAGYKTDIANSGVSGIEKVMLDPPDLVIVKLGLIDLPGDTVILRLQQIAKTKDTSMLLYIPKSTEQDKITLENISRAKGIKHSLEYNDPDELLKAAKEIFKNLN